MALLRNGGSALDAVETAVRMRHLPSGVMVVCRAERSQLQNRTLAMKMLKAKLYEIELAFRMMESKEGGIIKPLIDFGA